MGERHPRDVLSLVLGLLLVVAGGLFLLVDAGGAELDARWVAPLVLVGVGGAGLLASRRR